jgi:hypothetical protein
MPKTQTSITSSPQDVKTGDKHDFQLVALQAPNLHTAYYQGSVDGRVAGKGYQQYLDDYSSYRQALEGYKLETKMASKTKLATLDTSLVVKDFTVSVLGATKFRKLQKTAVYKQWGQSDFKNLKADDRVYLFDVDGQLEYTSGKLGDIGTGDHQIPWYPGASPTGTATLRVTATATPAVIAEVLKPKGPATTPKKVRTAEEIAERAKKESARKEKAAWFAARTLDLSKGKLEEKLGASVVKRALAISKADATVETHVDLDGWRVVTSKKGAQTNTRVKQRTTPKGTTEVKTFTIRNP